jgi:hypothetical protein
MVSTGRPHAGRGTRRTTSLDRAAFVERGDDDDDRRQLESGWRASKRRTASARTGSTCGARDLAPVVALPGRIARIRIVPGRRARSL